MNMRILNRDVIKYMAIAAMLLNHIAFIFLEPGTAAKEVLTDIGYFTGITMCWFLVEGYRYTRSRRRYAQRLFLFALLSQIPYCLAFTKQGVLEFAGFNMIFTLFICFVIVHVMTQWADRPWSGLLVLALVFSTTYSDWGILGPVITVLFARAGTSQYEMKRAWVRSVCLFGLVNFLEFIRADGIGISALRSLGSMVAPALAGICILCLYNGKRAPRGSVFSKWFFYVFYPGHLLVLGIIRILRL